MITPRDAGVDGRAPGWYSCPDAVVNHLRHHLSQSECLRLYFPRLQITIVGRTVIRTGAEYRDSLRDGRKVWVIGEGRVDDLTTHPATRAMVDYYVAWYDRHFDPEWQDVLLMPPDTKGERLPVAFRVPQSSDDLRRTSPAMTSFTPVHH